MDTRGRVWARGILTLALALVASLVAVPTTAAGDHRHFRPHVDLWLGLPSVVVDPHPYHHGYYDDRDYGRYRRHGHHHHGDDSDSDSDHRHRHRRHWR